ncbi:zinc-binding alcohol dehydrogenase family protein [Microbispora bryophytorum]|uniref:Probable alcohol dehydrogenase AdhA n=1 Tax=Microbispora bryophytorum TaxID=1460882 RepID=A0A8H9H288_9ACTN|nr:zinc-binding alcohol dehydrogenase family protein [Microbispora bryophytorum]MBD3139339.1 zinc-binding alcohol dehydrogenase family protein [Microbispora bryophytorum]TQS03458.1 zinc-binding alcohol dehydrogenase family protein [Microbispora bryophytorum]GGO15100.1 alcohol dehydrogenase [Microbispora bryophytorum]
MDAWVVARPGPVATRPLERAVLPDPVPGPGELLVRVEACAVCRTDLHLAEGDLPPRRLRTVPGHEVVGRVAGLGPDTPGPPVGSRVGVAWLRSTCGRCRYCLRGAENLCPASTYTGWDADGGYAQLLTAPAAYVYPLPEDAPAETLAPLLCAGIIGYRALARADLPPGGRLGVYGFGASAHLTAQIAIAEGATVHVMTRSPAARELALRLGAASAAGSADPPPEPLDAAILFAPVGDLVPVALAALDRGGTLAVAGIHLTDIPVLNYQRHLFQERTLRSVTANTRDDGREFLRLAALHHPRVTTTPYPFDGAGQALADLAADRVEGAAVLLMDR